LTHLVLEMPGREVCRRTASDVTENVTFVAVATGMLYLVSLIWYFTVTIGFWCFLAVAILRSMAWMGVIGTAMTAKALVRREGVPVPATGWLWLRSIVRGLDVIFLWFVVAWLRGRMLV
jgi:hypothetical protein